MAKDMERAEILARETKALVFDQYGTIVDMQGDLAAAAAPLSCINAVWKRKEMAS